MGEALRGKLAEQGIDVPAERAARAANLLKERATFVNDMLEGMYLFTSGSPLTADHDPELRGSVGARKEVPCWTPSWEVCPRWTPFTASRHRDRVQVRDGPDGAKMGKVMPLYRLFVAGAMQGPGMFEVSELLGRDEVVQRLRAGLEHCRSWA